jgi:hypothetical protein
MRNFKMVGGLAAMLGVLAISAASASASEFEASGGAVTRGSSISKSEEFKTWPMTITCAKAATNGTVPTGKFASFSDEARYSSCTAFGGLVKVTVTPGHFEYNANGTESILETITLTPVLGGCKYEIPAQTGFTKETVAFGDETFYGNTKFPNGQQKLNIFSSLTGMHYTAKGYPCTGPKNAAETMAAKTAEESGEEGAFTGAVHEELPQGNLTWIK